MANSSPFQNTQSLATLAEQDIHIGVIENDKTGKLFLVDEDGNSIGGVAEKLVEEFNALPKNKDGARILNPQWCVSDFTPEDGEESFKLLHKRAVSKPLFATSRPAVTAPVKKKF
jgi:hypothetical protein